MDQYLVIEIMINFVVFSFFTILISAKSTKCLWKDQPYLSSTHIFVNVLSLVAQKSYICT